MMRTLTIGALLTACALLPFAPVNAPAHAKDPTYIGTVDIVRGPGDGAQTAKGKVFLDANRNATLDKGEVGVEGVMVSNGREVVLTNADGDYELPAYGDMNLFVSKPSTHTTPLSEQMVPQFYYVHKEAGSPALRFGGIAPTGPLPEAINFPLIEDRVGPTFQALAFGDTQPYSNREISYVRDTVGTMLTQRDLSTVEFLIFEGDVMGDDLSLYDRFKNIVAVGKTPQYFVGGNHDIDFDATSDADSFDTFRREWGPEYYSFSVGNVHIIVLDNVRYPCNGIDDHPFCAVDARVTYNGVVSERQLEWLRNDLAHVPEDKLIILNAHIPFQSYTDQAEAKHQTDNLSALVDILGDRPVLGLSGHTHTTENLVKGVEYAGWMPNTGVGPAPFHQIVTGGVSGAWWTGDLNDDGVPHGTQRLGSPRGYYVFDFDSAAYTDTYVTFGKGEKAQLHASFNTPRFRDWARALFAFAEVHPAPADIVPSVTVNDLGDLNMLTRADLEGGSWVAVNVWNGSRESTVSVTLNDGPAIAGSLTQPGTGEGMLKGVDYADPAALIKQATQGRSAFRSTEGGAQTAGFEAWRGIKWVGQPGPFQPWMLTRMSNHLWRVDLPADLPNGVHQLNAQTTDRYGRQFSVSFTFEVVDEIPMMDWNEALWADN
ncbi:MAG: calcineurin-like phosphoesterase C-terminal domain-containing protein [Pseudomonadota bacterium]